MPANRPTSPPPQPGKTPSGRARRWVTASTSATATSPPDAATAVLGPAAVQVAHERAQHSAVAGEGARALHGEAEPGGIVVERVGPAPAIAEADAAGDRGDRGRAAGTRVAQLGVDQ